MQARSAGLAAAIAVGIALSACGATSSDVAVDAPPTSASSTTEPSATTDPVAGLLGLGVDAAADEEQFNNDTREREKLVATCMDEADFTYHPVPPDTSYGTTVDGTFEIGPDERDDPKAETENDAYRAALSAQEQQRYDMTLAGVPSLDREGLTKEEMAELDTDGDGELTDESSYRDSCLHRASVAIPGVYEVAKRVGTAAMKAYHDDLAQAIVASSALTELASCLTAAGVKDVSASDAVDRLGADEGIHELDGVPACVDAYKTDAADARTQVDIDFYDSFSATIERYGVWAR